MKKKVSFKVAKAIKEAGYPQGNTMSGYWVADEVKGRIKYGDAVNAVMWGKDNKIVDMPTYIDVWLWLWREKGTPIQVDYTFCSIDCQLNDPEEAIIAAIEYLVENNLIK